MLYFILLQKTSSQFRFRFVVVVVVVVVVVCVLIAFINFTSHLNNVSFVSLVVSV